MKITRQHRTFYVNHKLRLDCTIWGESEKVSVHRLINFQIDKDRVSISNTAKEVFYKKVSRAKGDKAALVVKHYLRSLQDDDYKHLTPFYLKLINKMRGFMLYKDLRTKELYKVEGNKVYVDLGCGWFKSDYSFSQFNKLVKAGEIKPEV